MTWARCVLDHGCHAVDERRDHPAGAFEAECGHLLPMAALHDEPSGRPCQACADLQLVRAVIHCEDDQISGRPPGCPHHRAPRGRPGPTSESDWDMLERYRRAGKHRSTGRRAHMTRRVRTIELVDARTLVAHELTPDALDAGFAPQGRYVALCGAEVLPAAMEQSGRSCRWCVSKIPTQRSGASR